MQCERGLRQASRLADRSEVSRGGASGVHVTAVPGSSGPHMPCLSDRGDMDYVGAGQLYVCIVSIGSVLGREKVKTLFMDTTSPIHIIFGSFHRQKNLMISLHAM